MHSVALHRGGMLRILRGSVHPEGDRGNVEENEAKMLSDGKIYTEVAEKTGLSTATISRVSRCIKDGDEGYTAVLERMNNEAEAK